MQILGRAFATMTILTALQAFADPAEVLSLSIKRDATTATTTKLSFKKDIYVTNYYQVPYTVAIPYQEDETTSSYEPVTTSQYSCTDPNDNNSCGYHDVTEYQWVSHTQSVTKYNYEERCCETISQVDFDHVWKQDVEVTFPPEVALVAGEKEKVTIKLDGSETKPAIKVSTDGTIFKYKVGESSMDHNTLKITLASVPFLTDKVVGANTIGTVSLSFAADSVGVKFQDKMINTRVQSAYRVAIAEKNSNVSLGETLEASRAGILMSSTIKGTFDPEKDYVISISVSRGGFLMTKPVQFVVTKKIAAEEISKSKMKDSDLINHFALAGIDAETKLMFRDESPNYLTVHSKYQVRVSLVVKKVTTLLAEKSIERGALILDAKKNYTVSIADLGATADQLKGLVKGTQVLVELVCVRTSHRTGDVTFSKKTTLTVTK